MLCPSDAACSQVVFDEHNQFCEICLLGFKTDGQALGETIHITTASVPKLCPVLCFRAFGAQTLESKEKKNMWQYEITCDCNEIVL